MNSTVRARAMALIAAVAIPSMCFGQTADQADPSHHRLEFENECVRVMRASYGSGDKSDAMFDTAGIGVVIVALSGSSSFRVHTADGQSRDLPPRSVGETYWVPGRGKIGLENTSAKEVSWLVIWPKAGCTAK